MTLAADHFYISKAKLVKDYFTLNSSFDLNHIYEFENRN